MTKIKIFKTGKDLSNWILKNNKKYQITEIIVNNAYGVEIKKNNNYFKVNQ